MNKILIKNAILQESLFMIDNNYTADFNQQVDSVKGRLKITSFEKFRLKKEKVTEKQISDENYDNMIGKLELEYTNLNTYENFDTITWAFYLSDLDGFRYKIISDIDVICAIAENLDKEWDIYEIGNFIPKIKKKITLFYLLPDEETDYYFELNEGYIAEIQ